uniref:Uncharacterized protein n=1 Tax=Megaselia scalaris TaxID=36166 RepID=T1GIC4_MEGSC
MSSSPRKERPSGHISFINGDITDMAIAKPVSVLLYPSYVQIYANLLKIRKTASASANPLGYLL